MKRSIIISVLIAAVWCGSMEYAERRGIREGEERQLKIDLQFQIMDALHWRTICSPSKVWDDSGRPRYDPRAPTWP